MKYILSVIIFVNITTSLWAKDDHKNLWLQKDCSVVEAVPFKIESIEISPKDIVAIEKKSNRIICFFALNVGNAKITLKGIRQNKNYTVAVLPPPKSNAQRILERVDRELKMIPEIDVEHQGNKLILKGEILIPSPSSNQKNQLLKKYDEILKRHSLQIVDKTICVPAQKRKL